MFCCIYLLDSGVHLSLRRQKRFGSREQTTLAERIAAQYFGTLAPIYIVYHIHRLLPVTIQSKFVEYADVEFRAGGHKSLPVFSLYNVHGFTMFFLSKCIHSLVDVVKSRGAPVFSLHVGIKKLGRNLIRDQILYFNHQMNFKTYFSILHTQRLGEKK